jgi:hypothetical protein
VVEAENNLDLSREHKQMGSANGALEIIGRATGLLSDKPKGEAPVVITRVTVVLNRGRGLDGESRIIEAETRELEAPELAPGTETSSEGPRIES